jgi:uncharacterized protein YeaO (DUF488 family)
MISKIQSRSVMLKRAYEPPRRSDGKRILIDRLWPRGVKKTDAKIDEWMKDVAPTATLRKWFGHDPHRWTEFRARYQAELKRHPAELAHLRTLAAEGPVTLVYSAHDETRNNAVVLRNVLQRNPRGAQARSTQPAGRSRRRSVDGS